MAQYLITLRRDSDNAVMRQRTRYTESHARGEAEQAVCELHDRMSTRDRRCAWIDIKKVREWEPERGRLVINRLGYVMKAEKVA